MTTIKIAANRVVRGDKIDGKIVSSARMTESMKSKVIMFTDGSQFTKMNKTILSVERA